MTDPKETPEPSNEPSIAYDREIPDITYTLEIMGNTRDIDIKNKDSERAD